MKIVILVDNQPNPSLDLKSEHGLSIFVEFEKQKYLFDLGASDAFYQNAKKLGVRIEEIDNLIISHGHIDHTGGLEKFVEINKKARVYISPHIKNKLFFSNRRGSKHNISLDHKVINKNLNRVTWIDKSIQIHDNVDLICNFSKSFPLPKGNNPLITQIGDEEILDNFDHEIVVTIKCDGKIVVFSACSHNGILNILDTCSTYHSKGNIKICIGGMHLIDSDEKNSFENENEIQKIGTTLKTNYPDLKLITGHCTGSNAAMVLAPILNFRVFHTGQNIEI